MGSEAGLLSHWRDRGQREIEGAAKSDVTLNPDPAVVCLDNSFRDREPEPDSTTV